MAGKAFTRRLLKALAQEGIEHVMPALVSSKGKPIEPFRRAIRHKPGTATEASIYIPHYWAIYVHEGRKAHRKKKGVYVWWVDPMQDPRLNRGETPERKHSLRRLTRDQYQEALDDYHSALRDGRPSPVVFRKAVGPTAAVRFFDNNAGGGMTGFLERANARGQLEFRAYALWEMRKALGLTTKIPITSAAPVILKPVRVPVVIGLGR